eukprot:6540610-Prymnesium_polylepis.1
MDERRRLLVREHREVGPQVVLHLVVEPAAPLPSAPAQPEQPPPRPRGEIKVGDIPESVATRPERNGPFRYSYVRP